MDSVNGAALGRSVDGVVLVVRADRAAQSAIERAVSGLTGAGSTILGVVGNGVDAGSTFGRAGGDHSQWPRSVDAAASR
jgi:Mrp family chromosome partitioning ATPase